MGADATAVACGGIALTVEVMSHNYDTEGRRHNGAVPSHELLALVERVLRMFPDRRDPERWHIDKDAVVKRLRALARQIEERAP
jgi:hypothetical protein